MNSSTSRFRWLKWIAVCAVLQIVCGCGETPTNRIEVSGKVTYEDKSIEDGTILFSPTANDQSQANAEITDGEYKVDAEFGPSLGEYKIVIEGFRAPAKKQDLGPLHANEDASGNDEQFIPAEFNSQSKLQVTITPENASALNFDLK